MHTLNKIPLKFGSSQVLDVIFAPEKLNFLIYRIRFLPFFEKWNFKQYKWKALMSPVHSAHVPEHIFKSASVHARSRSSREYSVASEHDLPRDSAGSHSSVYNLLESYV